MQAPLRADVFYMMKKTEIEYFLIDLPSGSAIFSPTFLMAKYNSINDSTVPSGFLSLRDIEIKT